MSTIYRIIGQVVDRETGFGVPGLRIEGWDKDLICNDLVGSTVTDELGNFRMTFDSSYFQELFIDRRPDLFFKVFQDDKLIKSTEDAIIWNASVETAPIRIEVDQPGGFVGYRPRVVVKFKDYVDLPYEDKAERHINRLNIGPFEQLAKKFPGISFKKLYRALEPEKIKALINRAADQDPASQVPRLLRYFMVECPPNVDPHDLAKQLAQWPSVQSAYFDPPGSDPLVNPTDDPRWPNQGYLDPAPNGIDAEFAWTAETTLGILGGDGAGQSVIDLEQGWTLNHEDLAAKGAGLLHGTVRDGSRAHGTAVLGEICAVDNTLGCVGIAPNVASVNVVSYWGSNRPDAILAAIANLAFGNVLLLEAQLPIAGLPPIEVLDAEFDTIRLATMLGIVVVEAAGNGSTDLDTYTDGGGVAILNRGAAGFRDSGAIMVGAASSAFPHVRISPPTWSWGSNYGSRIDCYAWGENVNTCYSNDTGSTTAYTTAFNGTSSASPIITGAALAIQGIAEANIGYRFSPYQLRALLSDPATGTTSNNPAVDRIGVMPNLRAIIEGDILHLAPDIYLRDFVGDAGNPHTGRISTSPDIILRLTTVADPQATYGEGSGTENSETLGSIAEAGQDNYIYMRVRNRGGSPATNVVATVYWAPVASLVTPDLWQLIGSTTLPSVPEGDILTVSSAIPWAAADIPATGHYCFVGLVGTAIDPPPALADLLNWDYFYNFIRNNNNVTWRNFNVVDALPDPSGFIHLPFIVPGLPDFNHAVQLEVVARFPRGAFALLEQPLYIAQAMREYVPLMQAKEYPMIAKLPTNPHLVRLPIHVHGIKRFREFLLPAKSRTEMKLLVQIPDAMRKNAYEIYVRHLYKGEEVGRITWRIVPPKPAK